jgi:hypothetical protein
VAPSELEGGAQLDRVVVQGAQVADVDATDGTITVITATADSPPRRVPHGPSSLVTLD